MSSNGSRRSQSNGGELADENPLRPIELLERQSVTIEAQILDLIEEFQEEFGTAVLFITHDMSVINEVADCIAVIYAGRIIETRPTQELFEYPKHPYTEALLNKVPTLDGTQSFDPVPGNIPDPQNRPSGCPFRTRYPKTNRRR